MSEPADDDLKFDLSAWEAPEPPQTADELADVVVARLGGTEVGAAIPLDDAPTTPRRRALLIAGVAAAVIAVTVGVWSIVRNTEHAAPRDGMVRADKAQSLQLDAASAELDPGADVRWHRHGSVLEIEQRTGNATWRVGTEAKLVIDAGAMVASVEATGASLRVEVQPMNSADARVIGATALTAAAVAMVTVVVYEGHVKVRGNQQTVIVEPGSTYKITPPPVTADEPIVGVGPVDNDTPRVVTTTHPTSAKSISEVITSLRPQIEACDDANPSHGVMKLSIRIEPDGSVKRVDVTGSLGTGIDDCVKGVVAAATFPASQDELVVTVPISLYRDHGDQVADQNSPPSPPDCDADVFKDKGIEDVNVGMHAAALAQFEKSLRCKMDPTVLSLAFMAACNGKNKDKAQLYYEKLPADKRQGLKQLCVRNNIALTEPVVAPATCDADALKDKGMEDINMGQHAAALSMFEASLRCKNDPYVISLAFMASCNVQNQVKAQSYYDKLDATQRAKYEVLCIRNKVALTAPTSAPKTCDADKLKDKGMELVNEGEHAKALVQFEASLACKQDAYVTSLAFMTACNAGDGPKAREHYAQLGTVQQNKLKVMCERNHISLVDPFATPTAPVNCDADLLKEKGMENINMGQQAAALAQFEASLRCKQDPYVTSLAFMAACTSGNSGKAKLYYPKLAPAQQQKLVIMCTRNHIDPVSSDAADPTKGTLAIFSKPAAKILVDGKQVIATTPGNVELSPGKHKVTFVVGQDRFTYPVVIKAGETETMSKDLQ